MTVVVDASTVAAYLIDDGSDGRWAETVMGNVELSAPHVLPAEVANVLRRAVTVGRVSADFATLAHDDLVELRIDLAAYRPLAPRIWQLRANVTAYDAWYVALAEELEAPLATLDTRLARAPGPRCSFLVPR